ncbi:MAG TPA: hypothetical protein VFL82_11825 [Thermomicrobiales bacterium]|jgi:hypothetical protein|nr:hypothetical protein [Thermomicrobiales bacterium]
METRFTDRIERAIREERQREARWPPATQEDAALDAADSGMANPAEDDASHDPSAVMSAAYRPAGQPAADHAVTPRAS